MTTIEAKSLNEGIIKVASLTLIGRGVPFIFKKKDDLFTITCPKEHADVFPKGTDITENT